MTRVADSLQWLRDHKAHTSLCDGTLKLIVYTGRFGLLHNVAYFGRLRSLTTARECIWFVTAIRDLFSIPKWITDYEAIGKQKEEDGKPWYLFSRGLILAVRINFLAKVFLKGANFFMSHPYLKEAKAGVSKFGIMLTAVVDSKSLYKAVSHRNDREFAWDQRFGIGEDLFDLLNSSIGLEWIPAPPLYYVVAGLGAAICSLMKNTYRLWRPKRTTVSVTDT